MRELLHESHKIYYVEGAQAEIPLEFGLQDGEGGMNIYHDNGDNIEYTQHLYYKEFKSNVIKALNKNNAYSESMKQVILDSVERNTEPWIIQDDYTNEPRVQYKVFSNMSRPSIGDGGNQIAYIAKEFPYAENFTYNLGNKMFLLEILGNAESYIGDASKAPEVTYTAEITSVGGDTIKINDPIRLQLSIKEGDSNNILFNNNSDSILFKVNGANVNNTYEEGSKIFTLTEYSILTTTITVQAQVTISGKEVSTNILTLSPQADNRSLTIGYNSNTLNTTIQGIHYIYIPNFKPSFSIKSNNISDDEYTVTFTCKKRDSDTKSPIEFELHSISGGGTSITPTDELEIGDEIEIFAKSNDGNITTETISGIYAKNIIFSITAPDNADQLSFTYNGSDINDIENSTVSPSVATGNLIMVYTQYSILNADQFIMDSVNTHMSITNFTSNIGSAVGGNVDIPITTDTASNRATYNILIVPSNESNIITFSKVILSLTQVIKGETKRVDIEVEDTLKENYLLKYTDLLQYKKNGMYASEYKLMLSGTPGNYTLTPI